MKIYFVRHGKTEWNGTGKMTGHTDIPLVEEGIHQAEEASKHIPEGITALYSSDLIRCKQTADILNRKLNLPVIYDPRLRERDFGSLAGSVWKEIDPDGALRAKDIGQEWDYREYGGEAAEDMKARVRAFIDDVRRAHPEGKIIAVSSAGFIRSLHHILGESKDVIKNADFHEFEF